MSESLVNLAVLQAAFPKAAIKTRPGGGGKRLSYVEGHTVIHRLIEATGNNFTLTVKSIEWPLPDLCMATVALTLPGLGTREHIGVQKAQANSGEDLIKGAITDALKKAATLFGVGLELYGDTYEEPATATNGTSMAGTARDAKPVPEEVAADDDSISDAAKFKADMIADPLGNSSGPVAPATINAAQLKRLFTIAGAGKWTKEEVRYLIAQPQYGGYSSTKDVTTEHYELICTVLGDADLHGAVAEMVAGEGVTA